MIKVIVLCLANVISKSGDEQRMIEIINRRDRNGCIIEKSALISSGCKEFVSSWIEHNADETMTIVLNPDRNAKGRKSVGEICGAVKRINHPLVGRG